MKKISQEYERIEGLLIELRLKIFRFKDILLDYYVFKKPWYSKGLSE